MSEDTGRPWSVISFRGPKELADRIETAAARRGVTKAIIQREAFEMYLLLCEANLHLASFTPVPFRSGASTDEG